MQGRQEAPHIASSLPAACLPFACRLPAACLPSACCLPADCLPSACILPAVCLPSACRLPFRTPLPQTCKVQTQLGESQEKKQVNPSRPDPSMNTHPCKTFSSMRREPLHTKGFIAEHLQSAKKGKAQNFRARSSGAASPEKTKKGTSPSDARWLHWFTLLECELFTNVTALASMSMH